LRDHAGKGRHDRPLEQADRPGGRHAERQITSDTTRARIFATTQRTASLGHGKSAEQCAEQDRLDPARKLVSLHPGSVAR